MHPEYKENPPETGIVLGGIYFSLFFTQHMFMGWEKNMLRNIVIYLVL
jgi:hypothetical protein